GGWWRWRGHVQKHQRWRELEKIEQRTSHSNRTYWPRREREQTKRRYGRRAKLRRRNWQHQRSPQQKRRRFSIRRRRRTLDTHECDGSAPVLFQPAPDRSGKRSARLFVGICTPRLG